MVKTRKRNAIHSGVGDNDDLLVKQPAKEDVTEEFQYAARLRGKKRHQAMIYPEIPFQYGISYKGKTLETYNEKPYEFHINAHPEKVIQYCIEQTKELPVRRLWEAKGCFQAEVWRMNMKYALNWKGKRAEKRYHDVDYAVNWRATVISNYKADAKDFFTSKTGDFIGYGDANTWLKGKDYIYDYSNVSRFSGIIAKQYYGLENYEAEFDFETRYATNDQHVGGNDDDIVGIIFKAKDKKNFYMMLWERDARVKGSWRAPDDLEGFDMLNSGESAWEKRVRDQGCASSRWWSDSTWNDYVNNRGWRKKHRRIYKVVNGKLYRVDTTPSSGKTGFDKNCKDLGNGAGWNLEQRSSIKIESVGRNVKVYVRRGTNGGYTKIFDFNTDWSEGSFGTVNVSQAVRFYRIMVKEKNVISGRIPESGYNTMKRQAEKSLGTGYNYCIGDARKKANKLKVSLPEVDTNTIQFISINGEVKDSSKGSITNPIGTNQKIVVKAKTYTVDVDVSGRVPQSGWFEWDGIGDKIITNNGQAFIKANDPKAAPDNVRVTSITGEVWPDPKYPIPTGSVIANGVNGQVIARSNNPEDAGQVYSECFIRCDIVTVTPDHRDYYTGLVVFEDIADEFEEEKKKFFNRMEYINKKEWYELLKPVAKEPPKPPKEEAKEGDCIIYEDDPEEEEEIIECLNDFDFDGKKLVMWSCEFPIEKETKCFANRVVAYRGWMTFDPLKYFEPNKWTTYELMPVEASINPKYDEIKWAGRDDFEKAPVGTKVLIRTTEWYRAIFPADIENTGIITSEENIITDLPPAPEHFWHPEHMNEEDIKWRMPDNFDRVHFLLDAWNNHPDVVMWWESSPYNTTETVKIVTREQNGPYAAAGRAGMPIYATRLRMSSEENWENLTGSEEIIYEDMDDTGYVVVTTDTADRLVIHCKEDPREIPWNSGKYIGYGKVNGKRPFFTNGSGRADMVNVSTRVVHFPDNLIMETLEGPFIDIYDEEQPDNPRVKYRLHTNGELVDFYSDFTDAHVWYTDWYSKWVEHDDVFTARMNEPTQIDATLDLDPTDPDVSDDYNPDDTIIERIEVTSNNPFVKLWIEEDKGKYNGLIGTYYRYPLTANIYEEDFQVTGNYQEWIQSYKIEPYMTRIEIPIQHDDPNILEVKIGDVTIPKSDTSGWRMEGDVVILASSVIQPGDLTIKYSTGDINNEFYLNEKIGEYVEVYVNNRLLDPIDYLFDGRVMTINKNQLHLHDWIHVQSYELNDLYDPTKRNYLGEKQYSQLDFQEDVPSNLTNPNYNDPAYEGSFSFNWGYGRPKGMHALIKGFKPYEERFRIMNMFLSNTMNFAFNTDMEIVVPIGEPVDISNFTGEWVQWDQDPVKKNYNEKTGTWTDGPGDWHGPPEPGYDRVTNRINQSGYSGWYNPDHVDYTDYDVGLSVVCESDWDNDIYGVAFRWNPEIMSGYVFEWDASGTNVKGMGIYKFTCTNPEAIGTDQVLQFTRERLVHKKLYWDPNKPDNTSNPDRVPIPHTIRVSAVGNRLRVWTDGELQLEAYDDTYKKGAWGPVTLSNPNTYFWDFWMWKYKRITYREEETFRQPFDALIERPVAFGEDNLIEIQIDEQAMEQKFSKILDDYCEKAKINKNEIISIEYFIRDDESDYEVYFKEKPKEPAEEKLKTTREGQAKIFATIEGQYPPIGDPEEQNILIPDKPDIPDLTPPTQSNPNDGFTVSWNGYIFAPRTGVYRFQVQVNDGFRLWIDGKQVISKWHVPKESDPFPIYEGSIYLEEGNWYTIRANYFDNVGQALVRLRWAIPGRGFQRISPEYLTPYLGYKLFAQVKQATPLPWHPMIHNGYYYHGDEEHYLYADKVVHKLTPNEFHEAWISPRPQQGSAIIVRDNEGNNWRKVTFYDDNWNLSLENKEVFQGNGYAKYYLSYKGIDPETIKVKINGQTITNYDYIFHEEESAIEFMEEMMPNDEVEVRYKLLYSYYVDMNPMNNGAFVEEDKAKIVLHHNYDPEKMKNFEVIYEGAMETPFYRATEVMTNPILNHNHTGFLYITENPEQMVKDLLTNLSSDVISDSGMEKVLLTVKVVDQYDNPIPNKKVTIYRDGEMINEEFITNHAGEVYFYDEPTPTSELISVYRIECEGLFKEELLNYYVEDKRERYYLDISAEKRTVLAGMSDTAYIYVTLRDKNWNPVGPGKAIRVEHRDTYGNIEEETLNTDGFGQIRIEVSGLNQRHGNYMIKVSYDMGFEETANYIYLKVIGG